MRRETKRRNIESASARVQKGAARRPPLIDAECGAELVGKAGCGEAPSHDLVAIVHSVSDDHAAETTQGESEVDAADRRDRGE